jgi:hypothetical protein
MRASFKFVTWDDSPPSLVSFHFYLLSAAHFFLYLLPEKTSMLNSCTDRQSCHTPDKVLSNTEPKEYIGRCFSALSFRKSLPDCSMMALDNDGQENTSKNS